MFYDYDYDYDSFSVYATHSAATFLSAFPSVYRVTRKSEPTFSHLCRDSF